MVIRNLSLTIQVSKNLNINDENIYVQIHVAKKIRKCNCDEIQSLKSIRQLPAKPGVEQCHQVPSLVCVPTNKPHALAGATLQLLCTGMLNNASHRLKY